MAKLIQMVRDFFSMYSTNQSHANRALPSSKSKIVVRKSNTFYDSNCRVPTYETHGKKRGEVLIINNIMFTDPTYKKGAQVDDENLQDLFKQMGFSVTVTRNLKKKGILSKVKEFSKKSSLKSSDILIMVIMSHGTKNETLGGKEVFGTDDEPIPVDDLVQNFNEKNCKRMAEKPKIFIFQSCRENNQHYILTDHGSNYRQLGDSLISYSTLPGFSEQMDPLDGTLYISTVCDIFSKFAYVNHVEDLFHKVNQRLGSLTSNIGETTRFENRGFNHCYLHPT